MLKIACIGDIIGRPGREMLKRHLKKIKEEHNIDLVIANGENASHGFGLTPKNFAELLDYGANIITGGNHSWDKMDIVPLLESQENLLRPLNYPEGVPGKGTFRGQIDGDKVAIVNLMGHYSMPMVDNPFIQIDKEINTLKDEGFKNIIIDFHAEATSEKRALFYMLQDRVSAIFGTHTHVGTDDLVIENGCGYVSDIGLSGCRDNVIGMSKDTPIKRFLTGLPGRFDVPNSCKKILQIVVFELEEGRCINSYKLKALDGERAFISQEAMVEK